MNEQPTRDAPQHILDILDRWDTSARWLRRSQVILGGIGTVAALVVTTYTSELEIPWLKGCSLVAALCIGVIAAFDVTGKANSTRRAWRHLNIAILRYRNVPASTLDNLVDSYSQAEAMIGDVKFNRPHDAG